MMDTSGQYVLFLGGGASFCLDNKVDAPSICALCVCGIAEQSNNSE